MAKRKSKPLTLDSQKKKAKKKNSERRANSEKYQEEIEQFNANRRERRNNPIYAAEERERDNSSRRERRNNPEYVSEERDRDNSSRQERRENPKYVSEEQDRDNSSRRERRDNPEYVSEERDRDNSSRQERRENPEYVIEEQDRDNSSRRERRENPEYVSEEQDRDNSSRRERRENPEYVSEEQDRDNSSRRERRENPEYVSEEQDRDNSSRRERRENPEYVSEEQDRDNSSRRERRENPEYSIQECEQDNSSRRKRRSDNNYLTTESRRDKETQKKRRSERIEWDEAFEKYNENVKDGPFHRCFSCDRLMFKTQVTKTTREKLLQKETCTEEYLDKLILQELIDEAEYYFCSTCMTYIRKTTYPRLNINNSNLRFPIVPDVVKNLTPLAQRLVAGRIPFMKIVQAGFEKQLKIVSGVINVPMDFKKTVQSIPQQLEESGVIEVSLMRKMEYRNAYMKEIVRTADIWNAAKLLCNTPLYEKENIKLDESMNPEGIEEQSEVDLLRLNETVLTDSTVTDEIEHLDRNLPEETMLDSADAIRFAPGEGEIPIPMFLDPYCEELAFPTIWFGHPRGTPPPEVRLSFNDHVNSEIRRYDRRACSSEHLFFVHKKCTIEQMKKQANIVFRKSAQTNKITATQVIDKQFIDNAVNNDSAYRFLSAIPGTPPYFEAQKKKVMATIRQKGSYTLFITNSAAETRWPELLVILKKTVDKVDISENEAEEMTFEEKARLISTDPVTCAQYFYYRLKELWKTWDSEDGPFKKYRIEDRFCRIEFQHRGSPHAHQFIKLKDVPIFDPDIPESYDEVCAFIDELITTDTDDPEVANIIYVQRHRCTYTCLKVSRGKKSCRFDAPFTPMDRTRILEPIPDSINLSVEKKKHLKNINKNLHDILESEAESILLFSDLLEKLNCNLNDYILAARSKLKRRKIFIKREPKNTRINPYIKKILIAMRSNMDAQMILDIYACVGYAVDYVNKSDKGVSRSLREIVEDHNRGNSSIKSKLSALSKVIYNSSETSAQEAAWIRCRQPICMSTNLVEFINSGPKSTRQRILKSNAELKKLKESDPNSTDIYKKGPIDRYSDRPDELENICLADFIALYTYHAKGRSAVNVDEEAQELEVIEDDGDDSEKKRYDLKNNSGFITLRKRPKIIRYCRFNLHQDPSNYYREQCLLFLPWRDEDKDVESQDCKLKFTQNTEIIKTNFDKYNASGLDLDGILQQIMNERLAEEQENETINDGELIDPEFQNVYDFDDNIILPNAAVEMDIEAQSYDITVTKYQVPNLIHDNEYLKLCDSLNHLQRDYLMDIVNRFKTSTLPIYHFISGSAGVGKSRLINSIYQSVVRIFRSEPGPVDSNEVLLVAYTGMAAHNIGGITAHSAFHLTANSGNTDSCLTPDKANTMACQLRNLKLIIIDEISMLSSEHFNQISCHLKQAFRSNREFAGRSVIVVGDFAQLRPIGGSYVFAPRNSRKRNSITTLVDNPQWHLFQMFELMEIMRQKDDQRFAEALNRLADGRDTKEDDDMFSSRCFPDENSLPQEAKTIRRLIAVNKGVDMFNLERARQLKQAGATSFIYQATDRFVGTYTESQKRKARHAIKELDKKDTQNLLPELMLVIGLRYMMSTNIDVSDGLFNGASGILRFVEIRNRSINAVFIEFDDKSIGAKARSARHSLISANSNLRPEWTPIQTTRKSFYTLENGSVQVSREQFPLLMSEAMTIHKSQGRSEEKLTVDITKNMDRQKLYVAFSRVTSLQGLFVIGTFKSPAEIEDDNPVKLEMDRLRRNPFIPQFQFLRFVPENVTQIISHNVQSIHKHITTIVADSVFTSSHILALQETWAVNNESYNIPDYDEISRNRQTGNRRAFGTINFYKLSSNLRISNQFEIENGDTKNHVELTGYCVDNRLIVVNIYNNPNSNLDLLKESISEIEEVITSAENVIIMGDFNHSLEIGNHLENFLDENFNMTLISPRKPTTNGGTIIDGVFGKLKDYEVECYIYESYSSYHKPIVIRIKE